MATPSRLFAISDLHLAHQVDKPMTRFGPHWEDHVRRVEDSWRSQVESADVVLVPGDLSWGMRERDSAEDLRWFGDLPGTKVIVKGNHDYWWPGSRRKLSAMLGGSVVPLKRNAARIGDIAFIGVRGCDLLPLHGKSDEDVARELLRELSDLDASIADRDAHHAGAARTIALFHYPPFRLGEAASVFTERLVAAGADLCVYGHLHEESEWRRTFQGEAEGIRYRLVSCDAIGFEMVRLD